MLSCTQSIVNFKRMRVHSVPYGSSFNYTCRVYGLACATDIYIYILAVWSMNDSNSQHSAHNVENERRVWVYKNFRPDIWDALLWPTCFTFRSFPFIHLPFTLRFNFTVFAIVGKIQLLQSNEIEWNKQNGENAYLRCRPHGHEFAGQSVGRVSIRWDHKWHKLTDEHFRIAGFPAELPTDCWKIENCCVSSTLCGWRITESTNTNNERLESVTAIYLFASHNILR